MAKALNPQALVLSLGASSAAACNDGGLAGHQIINDGAVAVLEAALCSFPRHRGFESIVHNALFGQLAA